MPLYTEKMGFILCEYCLEEFMDQRYEKYTNEIEKH